MFAVESYAAVRRFVFAEGQSRREAARVFGVNRETVAKMCRFSLGPALDADPQSRLAQRGRSWLCWSPQAGVLSWVHIWQSMARSKRMPCR